MTTVDEEIEACIRQTMQVDFLTERWEFEQYAIALISAVTWGKKVDRQNKDYFSKNNLIDKYNV